MNAEAGEEMAAKEKVLAESLEEIEKLNQRIQEMQEKAIEYMMAICE